MTKAASKLRQSDKVAPPRVVIFGAGKSGRHYLESMRDLVEVVAVVDNNAHLWGSRFGEHVVVDPARVPNLAFDWVVVTTAWVKEVCQQLEEVFQVPSDRILVPPKEATAGAALKNPGLRRALEGTLARILDLKHGGSQLFMPTYGTLLGIVRDGGLIPWDTDIDLVVLESDLEAVERVIRDPSFSQMIGQVGGSNHDLASDGTLKRISIEIAVEEVTIPVDIDIVRPKHNKMEFFSPLEREKIMVVDRSIFEPKRSHEWAGAVIGLPNRVEEFLELLYGPEWRTPNRGWTFLDHFSQKMFE